MLHSCSGSPFPPARRRTLPLFQRILWVAGLASCFAVAPASAQLETRASVPVLSNPISIAIGDFNSDGKPDLAVAAFYNGRIAVLLGNGNGTFKPATYYAVGSNETTGSVAAANLRGGKVLDLVVTNDLSNEIQVLLGNGDGTFGLPTAYPTPNYPAVVMVGDFNGDHKLDVVTVDESGYCPCVSVLLGNGDGTFQEPPIITIPPVAAVAIGIGDFDHDGILDLVTVGESRAGSQVGVLLGNGDGTFTPGESYTIGSGPQSVAVADFNGDHNLDLAVADALSGSIDILLGNGDGTFRQGAVIPTLPFPGAIQQGDFNGDGKVDLVFLTGVHSTVLNVLLGNGDGTFRPAMTFPLSGESSAIALADFNGDHRNDIAVAVYLGNSLVTLLNTGVVYFSPITPLNFKKQATGTTSAPQTVTLTNTGKTALTVSSMKATGQFAMTSTCGTSVAAGANCTISVTFSPKTKGAKSGTISINDSASSKPQVIELSGTGT
jgi:FG-GAP-like repeat/Abnormal spindle-like microcephaly-assoc'd, ASPM-SPD-2-Hydin